MLEGLYWMFEIKSELAACKAETLTTVLFPQPLFKSSLCTFLHVFYRYWFNVKVLNQFFIIWLYGAKNIQNNVCANVYPVFSGQFVEEIFLPHLMLLTIWHKWTVHISEHLFQELILFHWFEYISHNLL